MQAGRYHRHCLDLVEESAPIDLGIHLGLIQFVWPWACPRTYLPGSACLRLILFCTCPPPRVGALWPMPAWVWCGVRRILFFLLDFFTVTLVAGTDSPAPLVANLVARPLPLGERAHVVAWLWPLLEGSIGPGCWRCQCPCGYGYVIMHTYTENFNNKKHRTSRQTQAGMATAPLRTGPDMCRTGVGAGSSAGDRRQTADRRQSNHEWTDDQAGRRRLANTDSDGGSLVHAADDTPSKNAATRDTH